VSSAAVWSGALPYLTPRRDEFSLEGDHYEWNEVLAIDEWLGYLSDTFGLDTQDTAIRQRALNFRQPARELYFLDESFNIPLKEIRMGRGFNSTYFDVTADADSVRIEGRGFGHGTGLSQEGAMRMAALGFSYTDILHFYYNDVHIIDLRSLDFFLEE
jgi:stage II sporulation protein D